MPDLVERDRDDEPDDDEDNDGDNADDAGDVPSGEAGGQEDPEGLADLQRQTMHEAARRIEEVYGDGVHRNDGRHLHGGVEDDGAMCMLYDSVTAYGHAMYSPPKGEVGRLYINLLADKMELRGRGGPIRSDF